MVDLLVLAVLLGTPAPLGPRGVPSSIAVRRPMATPVTFGPLGLDGDRVGDPTVHGGADKAIHHYPLDHHAAWSAELEPRPGILGQPGAFGENLAIAGVTEADVCVGDVLRLGTGLVQVSQGRQPCFKLNHRFGRPDMALLVQRTGRTGWYYRVVEPGAVGPRDRLTLVDRPRPEWPLVRLAHLIQAHDTERRDLEAVATLPELAASWRALATRRLETGRMTDPSRRLGLRFGAAR